MWACVLLLLISRVAAGQTAAQAVAVTGIVLDQTGAVLPGASVDLVNNAGALVQSTTADGNGQFRFDRVVAGQYELRARSKASNRGRPGCEWARAPPARRSSCSV